MSVLIARRPVKMKDEFVCFFPLLSFHLSLSLSTTLSFHLSLSLSTTLSFHFSLSTSLYLSTSLFPPLSIFPPLSLSTSLFPPLSIFPLLSFHLSLSFHHSLFPLLSFHLSLSFHFSLFPPLRFRPLFLHPHPPFSLLCCFFSAAQPFFAFHKQRDNRRAEYYDHAYFIFRQVRSALSFTVTGRRHVMFGWATSKLFDFFCSFLPHHSLSLSLSLSSFPLSFILCLFHSLSVSLFFSLSTSLFFYLSRSLFFSIK
ncbi:unnamed protein product [Acanthosepion pharaonis]|uniref:Uncharacterized protein n=1 Tax=Acanthosepion pharaonis TaxID=158019 RepID=A0A812EK65_ACAPH|nr:unnamed protein product [Sepia pharaonis]